MYKRSEYKAGEYSVQRIENEKGSFFDVIPSLGAMVYRIGLADGNGEILDILRYDDPEDLCENTHFRGRVLFPFNDRIPLGRYVYGGKEYNLPVNEESDGSSIHGLIYDKQFDEVDCLLADKSGSLGLTCHIHEGDWKAYPFDIVLRIRYCLSDEGFEADYCFSNKGESPLPVALGWHPYFSLGGSVDSWMLKCGSGAYVAVDDSLIPTGDSPSVSGTPFDFTSSAKIGSGELDLAFPTHKDGISVLEDVKHKLTLYFDPSLFPYCQLYIPDERDSLAIEPVTAATNAFNIDGLGRIDLSPGESRSGTVKINLISK